MKANGPERPKQTRRIFPAEFKLEAVQRLAERQAQGVSLAQVGRELDVRPGLLRLWQRQRDARVGAGPTDVFPGHGRLPSEAEELRRLRRENTRLEQENAFLKKAAAYFAQGSR